MNLLTEPVFRVETDTGTELLSLPALLAGLGEDCVESLPGLQRHQEDAFHIFLCYLAGAVLARANCDDPCQDAAFWCEGMRHLAERDDDCAWSLVVDDVTQPAFMQPPLQSKADFKAFKPKADAPDALDLLPTAKNHDVKAKRFGKGQPEDWAYALISLQTMSGYFGGGKYGIARMNGGYASRARVSLRYSDHPGACWQRDISRLLTERSAQLTTNPWGYRTDGLVLTWLPPWDLKTSLSLSQLDPFFIEIARPVRLQKSGHSLSAWGALSKVPRIAAKDSHGVLGDPWTPINVTDQKKGMSALTVSAAGLTPKLLRNLLFEIGHIAGIIASEQFPTGERAVLKRLSPSEPPPLSFYRFAFRHLPEGWEKQSSAWLTIVAGIALMCPNPHRPDQPAGRELAASAYAETRLERLLVSEGDVLQTLLLRAARFLAAKGATVNWVDFACLLLVTDPDKRQTARLSIARDYYRHLHKKD